MFTAESLERDIVRITRTVFGAVLGVDVEPVAGADLPHAPVEVTGVVSVTGSWNGAIVFSCEARHARSIAATMFGAETGAAGDLELTDAIGEVANMIGGNFKAMLPSPAQLSLPSVIAGSSYRVNLAGCRELGRWRFRAGTDAVTVRVVERSRTRGRTT